MNYTLRSPHRHHVRRQSGYILSATIVISLAILTLIVIVLQTIAYSSASQNAAYYNSLAREAAQAGIVHANACIERGETSFTTLTPGSNCSGNPVAGSPTNVAVKDNFRSSYVVTKPTPDTVQSTGNLSLYRAGVVVSSPGAATVKTILTTSDGSTPAQPLVQLATTAVTTGGEHTCAISTGKVYCWGSNARGQIGKGGSIGGIAATPTLVVGLSAKTATAVESGADHTCTIVESKPAIATNEVYCWGRNDLGGVGSASPADRSSPLKVPGLDTKRVTRLNIGTGYSGNNGCAITDESSPKPGLVTNLYCWGANKEGQLGQNVRSDIVNGALPVKDPAGKLTGKTVVDVALGHSHTCAVTDDGAVHCWGSNNEEGWASVGTFGNGSASGAYRLVPNDPISSFLFGGNKAVRIAAGSYTTCIITDGPAQAYCWGYNGNGEVGNNTKTSRSTPALVTSDTSGYSTTNVTDIDIDSTVTCATVAGAAKCWGYNGNGQLGNGSSTGDSARPVPVIAPVAGKTATSIDAGFEHSCAVADTAIYCWGSNNNGKLGIGYSSGTTLKPGSNSPVPPAESPFSVSGSTYATAVAAGTDHSCAIIGGKAYCWGSNSHGQLGNNIAGDQSRPVLVTGIIDGKTLVKIVAGSQFTCALDSTNSIYCWGRNSYGQLGNNSTTNRSYPVLVSTPGGSGVVASLSAGTDHACAVINVNVGSSPNMPAYCWGRNNNKQLGDGSTTQRNTPTRVSGSYSIATVSAGQNHSCLTASNDNTLYCWGANGSDGVVGNNSTSTTNPIRISGGAVGSASVSAVYSGSNFSCALMQTNKNVCWGLGTSRELARNSTTSSKVPVDSSSTGAMASRTVVMTSVGGNNGCSITTDNSLICWGAGANKQLGDTSSTNRDPIKLNTGADGATDKIPASRTITDVSVGTAHSCAVADGLIYCWGVNANGQLGTGVNSPSNVPTQIPSYVPTPGAAGTVQPTYIAY